MAASDYEALWQAQLAPAQQRLLACAAPVPGETVLDVACGTGLVTLDVARTLDGQGHVVGVDLSQRMLDVAIGRAAQSDLHGTGFQRMDAEALELPDASFDLALCALGLMYMPDPEQALREMQRVLRPGGRLACAVWGERSQCGWSAVFPIVDAEVASEVCPLFFRLGQPGALASAIAGAGCTVTAQHRIRTTLRYPDATTACLAAFAGGPVAMAWSRFDTAVRARVQQRYLDALAPWRDGDGYTLPAEFVVVAAVKPALTW